MAKNRKPVKVSNTFANQAIQSLQSVFEPSAFQSPKSISFLLLQAQLPLLKDNSPPKNVVPNSLNSATRQNSNAKRMKELRPFTVSLKKAFVIFRTKLPKIRIWKKVRRNRKRISFQHRIEACIFIKVNRRADLLNLVLSLFQKVSIPSRLLIAASLIRLSLDLPLPVSVAVAAA
jgi:hypothetical protein